MPGPYDYMNQQPGQQQQPGYAQQGYGGGTTTVGQQWKTGPWTQDRWVDGSQQYNYDPQSLGMSNDNLRATTQGMNEKDWQYFNGLDDNGRRQYLQSRNKNRPLGVDELRSQMPGYQAPNDAATMAAYGGGVDQLRQQSQQGLMPEDLAAFWKARAQSSDFASQQRGAVQQQAQMQGGGVANGGQSAILQDQAGQMGANRVAGMDMQQAGIASQRRQQALLNYLQSLAGQQGMQFRNAQALNQFNQQNFGNLRGITDDWNQQKGAQDAAGQQQAGSWIQTGLGALGTIAPFL